MARTANPFPTSKMVQLQFADFVTITAAANYNASIVTYGLNAVDDPKLLGTGDYQPYGYSIMGNIYGKYLCHRITGVLEFNDPSVDGITVGFKAGSTTPTGLQLNVVEQQIGVVTSSMSNSGDQKQVFQFDLDLPQLIGLSKAQYVAEPDVYGAAIGSNPTSIPKLYLMIFGIGAGTPTARCIVRLVYHCRFYDRLTLAASQHA